MLYSLSFEELNGGGSSILTPLLLEAMIYRFWSLVGDAVGLFRMLLGGGVGREK